MPSRQVEVIPAEDDQPESAAPVQSNEAMTEEQSSGEERNNDPNKVTTDRSGADKRKITPAADKRLSSAKAKSKQQRTLVSFFSMGGGGGGIKRKEASTPSVVRSKDQGVKSKQPASKKQRSNDNKTDDNKFQEETTKFSSSSLFASNTTTTTSSKSKSTKAAITSKQNEESKKKKQAVKDVVLGRLMGHKPAASTMKQESVVADTTKTDPEESSEIPPSSMKRNHGNHEKESPAGTDISSPSSPSAEDNIDVEISSIRSQLVHKFDCPPEDDKEAAPLVKVVKNNKGTAYEEEKDKDTEEFENIEEKSKDDVEAPVDKEEQLTAVVQNNEDKMVEDDTKISPDDAGESPANMQEETDTSEETASDENEQPKADADDEQRREVDNATVAAASTFENSKENEAEKAHRVSPKSKATSSSSVSSKTSGEPAKECPENTEQVPQLSPECQELFNKHDAMKTKYCIVADKLVKQGSQGFEEEDFSIDMPSTEGIGINAAMNEFPDAAVPHLTSIVEGSKLPLSQLTKHACEVLNGAFSECIFSEASVSSKIKVLAERKPHVKNPSIAAGLSVSNNVSSTTDIFEDVDPDHVWRWEVATVEILPEACLNQVKKARSARRKFMNHFNATARLLGALDESIKLMSKGMPPRSKVDKVVAKISKEEEKVLKHERDAEKARLAAEAQKKKEENLMKEKKTKEEEKERLKEEKKRQIEEKKREKEEAKRKKALEREEAKRKKEEKEKEEQAKKDREEEKQRKRMMSFFGGPSKKAKTEETSTQMEASEGKFEASNSSTTLVDSDRFWSCLNAGKVDKPPFGQLSRRAKISRKRKSKLVNVKVFVSGASAGPENPFDFQPVFAEEQEIEIRNRNKFLSFTEDLRPPYHGTWSKTRATKNLGRKPFSKEPALDYEVDSEAEWEEGDDDPGEDVDNDAGDEEEDKDEEGDPRMYNYQDGWLAEDDDLLGDEDELDEEAKELLKSRKRAEGSGFVPVCIIAPADGGVPVPDCFADCNDPAAHGKVEGFSAQQAYKLAAAHDGEILADADICLDAFPPALVEEKDGSSTTASQNNEPTKEDLKTIARFVHHSNLGSKDKVIEELRTAHSSVTSSRAQGYRVLDSIAEKKRNPKVKNGVYWEVKQDVIESLGLEDLKAMKLPVVEESAEESKPKKNSSSKKKKSSDAKKNGDTGKPTPEQVQCSTKNASQSTATRKKPAVSAASARLLASFLKKK